MTSATQQSRFASLGLPKFPHLLAPLAGVSDHPFRRICARLGSDLTYVEMISATALIYQSRRTLDMLTRHPSEAKLGVQVTGKTAEEVGEAVAILDTMPFDTIDINMGCPVKKVVKTGCGSGILKDPERVFRTVAAAREATAKPLSAKIRLGWDHSQLNALVVTEAIEAAGADFITVHGRTRSDDYAVPVNLEFLAEIKAARKIPIFGNGNIFSAADADHMRRVTKVDGVMVSRGALGNPWLFRELRGDGPDVSLDEWLATVSDHVRWQRETYGDTPTAAVCMRKHLLWYAKGWPGVKLLRDRMNTAASLDDALALLEEFRHYLLGKGEAQRKSVLQHGVADRFVWDPKWEMDRQLDRGVGDDGLVSTV